LTIQALRVVTPWRLVTVNSAVKNSSAVIVKVKVPRDAAGLFDPEDKGNYLPVGTASYPTGLGCP